MLKCENFFILLFILWLYFFWLIPSIPLVWLFFLTRFLYIDVLILWDWFMLPLNNVFRRADIVFLNNFIGIQLRHIFLFIVHFHVIFWSWLILCTVNGINLRHSPFSFIKLYPLCVTFRVDLCFLKWSKVLLLFWALRNLVIRYNFLIIIVGFF